MKDNHWGENLVGLLALHVPSQTIGKVVKFYDGVDSVYTSTTNNAPVEGPVVAFESGDTFVGEEDSIVPLTPEEGEYYVAVLQSVGLNMKACAEAGAKRGMTQAKGMLLIGVALKTYVREINRMLSKAAG